MQALRAAGRKRAHLLTGCPAPKVLTLRVTMETEIGKICGETYSLWSSSPTLKKIFLLGKYNQLGNEKAVKVEKRVVQFLAGLEEIWNDEFLTSLTAAPWDLPIESKIESQNALDEVCDWLQQWGEI